MSRVEAFRREKRQELRDFITANVESWPELQYPLDTSTVFGVLRGFFGYWADRAGLSYCVAHGIQTPKKDGRRMGWSEDDVLRFLLSLEERRAWLPGWHDDKKTCFELDAETEVPGQWAGLLERARRRELSAAQLVSLAMTGGDPERIADLERTLCQVLPEDTPAGVFPLLARLHKAEDPLAREMWLQAVVRSLEETEWAP